MRKSTTNAVIASGDSNGRTRVAIDSSPRGSGCRTSTSIGFCPVGAGPPALVISSCRSFSVPDARSSAPDVSLPAPSALILLRRLVS